MSTSDISQVIDVPIKEIFADPEFNCRGLIAPIDIIDLMKDIDVHGLQQPIVIKPFKDNDKYKYKVISGHRRHKAFEVLERETIPCSINAEIADTDALILNLGENLHRQDLNILQEAKALRRLKMEGFAVVDVAQELGKSTTWVNARFQLLELPEEIQKAAAAGFITQSQIRDLHKLDDYKKQIAAARKIKDARARGERVPQIHKPKRSMFKTKVRDVHDINYMMEHIVESLKANNFGTRCLAWAAGEINDFDLYQDIEQIAVKAEIPYEIPHRD